MTGSGTIKTALEIAMSRQFNPEPWVLDYEDEYTQRYLSPRKDPFLLQVKKGAMVCCIETKIQIPLK